jgi:hypothetical protein
MIASIDSSSPAKGLDTAPMPPAFYVVGKSKFALLFVATSGFYFFYWMYRNWKRYRAVTDNKVWPLVMSGPNTSP